MGRAPSGPPGERDRAGDHSFLENYGLPEAGGVAWRRKDRLSLA